jgi:hypothetical protein
MNEDELSIIFDTVEERIKFMEWLQWKGMGYFMKETDTDITCMSTCETGQVNDGSEYGEMGFIEFQ